MRAGGPVDARDHRLALHLRLGEESEHLGRAGGGVPTEEEIIAKVNKIYNG